MGKVWLSFSKRAKGVKKHTQPRGDQVVGGRDERVTRGNFVWVLADMSRS